MQFDMSFHYLNLPSQTLRMFSLKALNLSIRPTRTTAYSSVEPKKIPVPLSGNYCRLLSRSNTFKLDSFKSQTANSSRGMFLLSTHRSDAGGGDV